MKIINYLPNQNIITTRTQTPPTITTAKRTKREGQGRQVGHLHLHRPPPPTHNHKKIKRDSQHPSPAPADHPKPLVSRRSCQNHPHVTKSKDKAKGARKLRSCDVSLNHRLVSWRVVDSGADPYAYSGVSATDLVKFLSGNHQRGQPYHPYDDEEEDDDEEEETMMEQQQEEEEEEKEDFYEAKQQIEIAVENPFDVLGEEDEEDDDMGFFEVGIIWDYVDEEDWCVVAEL